MSAAARFVPRTRDRCLPVSRSGENAGNGAPRSLPSVGRQSFFPAAIESRIFFAVRQTIFFSILVCHFFVTVWSYVLFMLDTSGNNPAGQFLFGLINRFMERKRIMDVVINKRKIRDTVRQIVAGGNRTLKQEIRSRLIAGMATGRQPVTGGFVPSGTVAGNVL